MDEGSSRLSAGAVEGCELLADLCMPGHEQRFVGHPVRVYGLSSRPELNGKLGWTVSFKTAAARFGVEVDGVRMAVRPQNLQLCHKGDHIIKAEHTGGGGDTTASTLHVTQAVAAPSTAHAGVVKSFRRLAHVLGQSASDLCFW